MSAMRRFYILPTLLLMFLLTIPSLEKAAAVPPDSCNEVIFYSEDHEGASEWTSAPGFPSSATYALGWDFETSGIHSYSGSNNWFADNWGGDYTTEARLNSPEITIPSNASNDIFLRFYHYFKTELSRDGGIVELSVGGSEFIQIAKDDFTQTDYPITLSGGTVLGSVDAFSGTSPIYPSYSVSIVDLSGLVSVGDNITIRFRMATDVGTADDGWYVDDVELGYCAVSNTPPAVDDLAISTLEDTSVNGTIIATDDDGDLLTFSADTLPTNGIATVNADGSFTYTPNANYSGNDSFTVLVDDGNGGTDAATVDVTILGVNDVPSFTLSGDPPTVGEDAGQQTISGFASNIGSGPINESGQNLSFDLTITAGSLTFASAPTISASTGDLTYATSPNANGAVTLQVELSDDGGTANGGLDTSAPQTFIITVNPINDPPVANDLNASTTEDTPLNGVVTAGDPDGDILMFSLGTPSTNGTAMVNPDGSFAYTPAANFAGMDSFTVSVSDGNGGSDTATVTVDVSSMNDNPVVTAGTDQTADLNFPVTVNATYIDADAGDTHTATIDWGDVSPVESVLAASGSVSGIHTYATSGNFTITITVSDNNGGSGSDNLIINVNAPTFTPTPTATATSTNTPLSSPTPTATVSPSASPTDTMPTATPTGTSDAEPPPPAPLAADVNDDPGSVVRVGLPDQMRTDVNVRVIVVNGEYPEWQGSELANAGFIGIQGVLDMGVRQAVDIFSPTGLRYFEGGIVVCLRGEGTLVYLNANNAPRIAEIVGSYTVPEFPGFTCVTLFEPGTLVLVDPLKVN